MHVRQLGWLHATPEQKDKKGPPDKRSRLQRLAAVGREPVLPEVTAGGYLLDWLFEVGPALPGGMGPVPLTHGELRSWQANTGLRLTPWEARTLRHLSSEYLAELRAAEEPSRAAPYSHESTVNVERTTKSLRAAVAAMARN